MSKKAVVGMIRRFLHAWGKARRAKPSVLESTIMRINQVQYWFAHNRGVPMVRKPCGPCATERLFTIWGDGRYYCMTCLYKDDAQLHARLDMASMQEFSSSWLEYVRRIETFEDPWSPTASTIKRIAHLSRLRPPPVCEVEECMACQGLRPFMRREDGDGGCIFCLMQGRIVEIEIETVSEHAAA